jgi:DNA-binding beta-propeller fold protein YncE
MRLALRVALFISLLATFSTAADPGYHVIKTYKLGGEGGWDYLNLDGSSRRLYISRATHVIVIDADSGKPVGDIPDTPGVHGIALAPELGRGFVSNGREGTVTIFDIQTLKLISKVKVGDNPDAILYDPATKRVFTFNGKSQDSTAIDAANGTVLGTIKL